MYRVGLIIFICFFVSFFGATKDIVKNGVVNLSSHNFQSTKQVKLDGDWGFAKNKFVPPEAIHTINQLHAVPHLWEDPTGYATYSLQIILPQNSPELGLQLPDIYSSYQLTINGQYADIKGYAAAKREDAIPFRMSKIIPIPLEYDTLNILIHASNYRHHKGGIGKPIVIGDLIYLEHWAFLSRTFDAFIGGSLMVGFFFFLGLYLYGRHDKTSLYFALFCLTYSVRVCFSGNHMINHMIPSFPWDIQIRIEYATLYLTTIFFGYFVYYLFPKTISKIFVKAYTVIAAIFIPLALFTPPFFFTQANIIHLAFMLLGIFIITFLFLKSVVERVENSVYSLLSILGFLIVLSTKTLDYFNIFDEILLITFLGQIFFFLSHALVLSNHFSNSWKVARDNAEASAIAKTNFLSVMSHEIRTPLNSVIGTTHHLIDNYPRKDQQADLKNLKTSSENLLGIINNILDFNKIESGNLTLEMRDIDLNEFMFRFKGQVNQLAEEKGLELSFEIDTDITPLKADETRLTQVLGNLIHNAIKFTDSGVIKVCLKLLKDMDDRQTIEFVVIDSGIGIKEQDIEMIFDPFKQVSNSNTRNFSGTGLGLTITKRLVELMGSNLKIESWPKKGSKFFFDLTLMKGVTPPKPNLEVRDRDLHETKVLLVDDHDLNVLMTKNFLIKWKADVTVAMSGQEAIEKIEDNNFDVILMDIQMPEMDGFEASKAIRNKGYGNTIIAVTADSYQEPETFMRAGINDYLSKPFDPKVLYQTIKSNIHPKSGSGEIETLNSEVGKNH